jgi:putative membrane-bound dehydrogenase-like protein
MRVPFVVLLACLTAASAADAKPDDVYEVGAAAEDITPSYSIRLSGFGFRRAESEGVTQRIWAKALAIDDGTPAVVVTVDNLGIPARMVAEVAGRLEKKAKLPRERFAVTATHTHTAPMLTGVAPTLFGTDIPKEHQQHIDRYTTELTDKLEKVALAALADRKPSRLHWGIGKVGFAVNRRTKGGPVDHDLPVLTVRDLKGKLRAIYVNYACHCVTLSNNKISGDWAGYAQELIHDDFPDAIALISVGCGADSNPSSGVTGDKTGIASRQGAEIAREVKRLVKGYLTPVKGKITASIRRFELPLADPPTREQWEAKGKRTDAVGYHARVNLARLDRKEALKSKVDYSAQTWRFGDRLAMIFLPGEVVVDYSLRMKRELDGSRLWINAYANDDPCYIPSERVLKEGGYEGGGAMVYYDLPGPFRPGLEAKILEAVHAQLDERFRSPIDPKKTGDARPLSPWQSQALLRSKADLTVDLVAAEPLVASPVAIDWSADGRLWVAEMVDYPAGSKGDFKPGGRIKVLEDTDGDGRYDKATIFLDNIPFPTGLTVWRKGVLVCAAPDILYAEDADGDGKAEIVKKLFSGFGTDNYQARVNSLEYGLDGWVYGSCGLFGGQIRSFNSDRPVSLGDRDFRIRLDSGELEPATGRTQQGRVRNDWGDWFGCDNSTLCRHYPLPDHYLRRNPHLAPPEPGVLVTDYPDWNRLYSIQEQAQRFKLSGPANRVTAACGLGIYRDDLMGKQYTGDAFVCEPVNLVVHRMKLSPRGSTFSGRRAADEKTSEFLASTDTWFRPVQARTGPDGALWIVDMYRYVIEHPRWIPPEELAKVDVRAGSTLGRIYRIHAKNQPPRALPRLDQRGTAGLVAALDSANGWQRDLAGQMLVWKRDVAAAPSLEKLAEHGSRAESRLQALCVLDGLGCLTSRSIRDALRDKHPGVRRHGVRLAEKRLSDDAELGPALLTLIEDSDAQVRLQLAFTLGAWRDPRAGKALASLLLAHADDTYFTTAVLSGVHVDNLPDMLAVVFRASQTKPLPERVLRDLLGLAAALGDAQTLSGWLKDAFAPRGGRYASWQLTALAGLLDTLERRRQPLDRALDESLRKQIAAMIRQARVTASSTAADDAERRLAVSLLGRAASQRDEDWKQLGELLTPQNSFALQSAAVAALGRSDDPSVPRRLTANWAAYSPTLKGQILDLLLSRAAWHGLLLDSIEKKTIPAAEVDTARRQRLLSHRDAAIRARAAKVFAGAIDADRRRVLDSYKEVTMLAGDRRRGQMVFTKSCSVCHRLDDVGHAVGPDLAALANKTPLYLLTEILDPNRNVDSRYLGYTAITRAGRTFTGLLADESATSISLRGQEGKETTILRSEIDELQSSGKSLMPEGLEKELSKQDVADLIAYLTARRPRP